MNKITLPYYDGSHEYGTPVVVDSVGPPFPDLYGLDEIDDIDSKKKVMVEAVDEIPPPSTTVALAPALPIAATYTSAEEERTKISVNGKFVGFTEWHAGLGTKQAVQIHVFAVVCEYFKARKLTEFLRESRELVARAVDLDHISYAEVRELYETAFYSIFDSRQLIKRAEVLDWLPRSVVRSNEKLMYWVKKRDGLKHEFYKFCKEVLRDKSAAARAYEVLVEEDGCNFEANGRRPKPPITDIFCQPSIVSITQEGNVMRITLNEGESEPSGFEDVEEESEVDESYEKLSVQVKRRRVN